MAIEKQVNIRVNTDDGVNKADKLAKSFKNVDKEAEKASKSIDDISSNGGAIAILDQLTGGLATRFKDAYEATKLFNFSLKGVKTALIATGIGAFVVAVGLVVSYWEDIVALITGANAKLQTQINLNNEILNDLGYELKLLEAKEKVLIAEGKSTEEILAQKKKIILLQQEENALLLDNLKTQYEREKAQIREVTLWEKIKIRTLQALGATELAGREIGKSIAGNDEQRESLREINKQIEEATLRSEQLKLSFVELNNTPKPESRNLTVTDTSRDEEIKREKDRLQDLSDFERELRKSDEDYYAQTDEEKLELKRQRAQTELDNLVASETEKREAQRLLNEYYDQLESDLETQRYAEAEAKRIEDARKDKELKDKQAKEDKERDEAVQSAKVNLVNRTAQLVNEIVGAQSAVGKGFAVASATISGIEGVQNAYTSAQKSPLTTFFPAYPIVQAGLAGAFSALQIKKILSTNPKGATSAPSNLGGGAGGATAPQAPSFNLVSGSGTNQIAESIAGDRQPLRAYVVSGDVTSQQSLDRTIEGNASI